MVGVSLTGAAPDYHAETMLSPASHHTTSLALQGFCQLLQSFTIIRVIGLTHALDCYRAYYHGISLAGAVPGVRGDCAVTSVPAPHQSCSVKFSSAYVRLHGPTRWPHTCCGLYYQAYYHGTSLVGAVPC